MAASKSRISLRCSDTRGQVAASIFPRISGNVNIENSLKIRKNENRKNTENRTENGRLKRNENRYEFEKLENESHKTQIENIAGCIYIKARNVTNWI